MLEHFTDHKPGGFFFTADDHESLILRPKTFGDDATPADNGVAARVLLRLGFLLAEPRYLDAAERTLRAPWSLLERYPHGHTSLLMALDELTGPPTVVVLRGAADDLAVWRAELDKLYDPRRFVWACRPRRPACRQPWPTSALGNAPSPTCAAARPALRPSRPSATSSASLKGRG